MVLRVQAGTSDLCLQQRCQARQICHFITWQPWVHECCELWVITVKSRFLDLGLHFFIYTEKKQLVLQTCTLPCVPQASSSNCELNSVSNAVKVLDSLQCRDSGVWIWLLTDFFKSVFLIQSCLGSSSSLEFQVRFVSGRIRGPQGSAALSSLVPCDWAQGQSARLQPHLPSVLGRLVSSRRGQLTSVTG